MNASQRAKWERTRVMGFWRYALLMALVFSGAMSIAFAVFDYLTNPSNAAFPYLIRTVMWLVTGLAIGVTLWFYAEHKYKKNAGE